MASCGRPATEAKTTADQAVVIPTPQSARAAPRSGNERACSASEEAEADFATVWPRLRAHVEAGLEGIEPLVDPELGIFVIDDAEAYGTPMLFESVAKAAEFIPRAHTERYRMKCPEARVDATTPTLSCQTEKWSTTGCVITEHPYFSVAQRYEDVPSYRWSDARITGPVLEHAQRMDAKITHGVYATEANLAVYFGRVGCSWRVLVIDAIPCTE